MQQLTLAHPNITWKRVFIITNPVYIIIFTLKMLYITRSFVTQVMYLFLSEQGDTSFISGTN